MQVRILVMGDMNGHTGMLDERMNEMLIDFVSELNLGNLNETLAEGRVAWNARYQESAINYMLVNGRMREIVSRMRIDEDGMIDIVSHHNILVVECMASGGKKTKRKNTKKKWRLRDVGWENLQVDLSERD